MNNHDKINFEYSLRPNGMGSKLFWELNQIVANQIQKPFVKEELVKHRRGIFPEGTDLEEVRQAVRDKDWNKVRRLTGALI